jgi:hypothetical protein
MFQHIKLQDARILNSSKSGCMQSTFSMVESATRTALHNQSSSNGNRNDHIICNHACIVWVKQLSVQLLHTRTIVETLRWGSWIGTLDLLHGVTLPPSILLRLQHEWRMFQRLECSRKGKATPNNWSLTHGARHHFPTYSATASLHDAECRTHTRPRAAC